MGIPCALGSSVVRTPNHNEVTFYKSVNNNNISSENNNPSVKELMSDKKVEKCNST